METNDLYFSGPHHDALTLNDVFTGCTAAVATLAGFWLFSSLLIRFLQG